MATPFQDYFCYVSFSYVSTLPINVVSAAPVKHIFRQCSNNSDYIVFENVGLEGMKNRSFRTTAFPEFFLLWKF